MAAPGEPRAREGALDEALRRVAGQDSEAREGRAHVNPRHEGEVRVGNSNPTAPAGLRAMALVLVSSCKPAAAQEDDGEDAALRSTCTRTSNPKCGEWVSEQPSVKSARSGVRAAAALDLRKPGPGEGAAGPS